MADGGVERPVFCYAPSHGSCQPQSLVLPLVPLSPAACSPSEPHAAGLPLPGRPPFHARCTCWHTVGSWSSLDVRAHATAVIVCS